MSFPQGFASLYQGPAELCRTGSTFSPYPCSAAHHPLPLLPPHHPPHPGAIFPARYGGAAPRGVYNP
ncbi:unnamed protein product [Lampetra fluviatilis]